MTSKSHSDNNNIRIDYRKKEIDKALSPSIYKQVKKNIGQNPRTASQLFHILDNHTLQEVQRLNKEQNKISCIKRPNIRAILVDNTGRLLLGRNNQLIIGTNNIEKTENNNWGDTCQRLLQQIDSTQDKLLCAVSCKHTGCAEKNLMNMATTFGVDLFGSKIILFGHTNGPCSSCCEILAGKGIKAVIIGSPPESKSHKDYDIQFANTGYKIFLTPEHLLRRVGN